MGVRKCPKCGSVWYTALTKCAFCGIEGEEVKGPISPAKLNLGKRGVESGPPPGHNASDRDAPVGSKEPAELPIVEAPPPPPPPPPPAPEPPKEVPVEVPKPEPPPVKVETPAPIPIAVPEPPPVPAAAPSADEAIARLKAKGYKAMTPNETPVERPAPASALRPVPRVEATAPAPQIPSATVPMVFGFLGLAASVLLPLTSTVRQDKVLVTFLLLAWSILAPFAPFAWFTAQRYIDQCRALGFAPASGAQTGKVLGMLTVFLIVFEFSALAVFVFFQILSGKITCPLWK